MAVPIRPESDRWSVDVGASIPLFATRTSGAVESYSRQQYMVSRDGQRFLMNTVTDEATAPITVILNWSHGSQPAKGDENRSVWQNGSGANSESVRPVAELRPFNWLIRSVRDWTTALRK
jgi:hypothetical protein